MSARALIIMGSLAAVLVAGALLLAPRDGQPPELAAGIVLDPPRPVPAFTLVDQHGEPFTRAALERRWSIVFVGFTHCPDVCPDTLYRLKLLDQRLRESGGGLQTVFVSVDPERDTPEVMADYVAYFDTRFIGATGTRAQVDAFCEGIGVSYIRIPGAGGDYTVDHSAALLLIDPEARVAGYFMPPFDIERLVADLTPLTSGSDMPWH